jgi:uncharacterized protein YoxC
MYVEISLVLLSASVFLIAAVAVPLLFQVQRIVRGLTKTQEMLHQRLPALLTNLEETAEHAKETAATVRSEVEGLSAAMARVKGIAAALAEMEGILRLGLRLPVFKFIRNVGAAAKGIRVFLEVYTGAEERKKT